MPSEDRPSPQPSPGVPGKEAAPPPTVAQQIAKFKKTIRRLGPAAPLAIAVTILPPIGLSILITIASTTPLAATMQAHPYTAFPIYVVAFWVLGLCTLPTYAYSVLGGYVFGFWGGLIATCLAYAGAMCGAFAISRRIARDRVLPLIEERPTLAAVRRAVVDAGIVRGTLLIALLRISPASPFAITNAVLGAGGVGWTQYVIGSALGVLPRTAVVVYFAARLETLDFTSRDGWWMVTLGILATVIVILIIGRLAKRELDRQLKIGESVSR